MIFPTAWSPADCTPDAVRSRFRGSDSGEKRIAPRHALAAEIGLLHVGRDEDFCRIRNVSMTGLMAQIFRNVGVGDNVSVDLKCGQALRGKVMWAADHVPTLASRSVRQTGVRFHVPADIEPLLSPRIVTRDGTLHRGPRLTVGYPIKLVVEGGRYLNGRLCDISQHGAKVLSASRIPEASRVALVLRGLPLLRGSIRWQDRPSAGVAFDVAIALETLALWCHARRAEGNHTDAGRLPR